MPSLQSENFDSFELIRAFFEDIGIDQSLSSKLLHLVSSSTPQLIADDIMCQWQMNIYNLVRPNLEKHIWLCKKYDYQVTWNYN